MVRRSQSNLPKFEPIPSSEFRLTSYPDPINADAAPFPLLDGPDPEDSTSRTSTTSDARVRSALTYRVGG